MPRVNYHHQVWRATLIGLTSYPNYWNLETADIGP